jgi:flagellin
MTSQINGLNQAVKNANAAISLTQTVDGALVEVSDMLQRARELAVQSSSSTVSATERTYINDEISQLMSEIDRISASTQYNGQNMLDGSFTSKTLQIGANASDTMTISIDSAASANLGAYKVTGDVIAAQMSVGTNANITDAADDFVISGANTNATIDVTAADSAKTVAGLVNAVTGTTGVSAEAKTQAVLFTEKTAAETHAIKINGTLTGDFSISSTDVSAGVNAINAISSTTGVLASATSDNKIKLVDADGDDIVVENMSAQTELRIKALKFDGVSSQTTEHVHTELAVSQALGTNTTHTLSNLTTGVDTDFAVASTVDADTIEGLINTQLGGTTGLGGQRQTNTNLASLSAGTYYLKHEATGDVFSLDLTGGATTVANWTSAIGSAKYASGDHVGLAPTGSAADLLDKRLSVYQANSTGSVTDMKLALKGDAVFGDFNVYSDAALETDIMDTSVRTIGSEAVGAVQVRQASDVATNAGTGEAGAGVDVLAATATLTAASGTAAAQTADAEGQKVSFTYTELNSDTTGIGGVTFTVEGTGVDGETLVETVVVSGNTIAIGGGVITVGTTTQFFKTTTKVSYTAVTEIGGGTGGKIGFGFVDNAATYTYTGSRDLGSVLIKTAGSNATGLVVTKAGDIDQRDQAFTAQGTTTDAATVQGTIELSSTDSFNIAQSGTEETYPANDNYFTSATSTLSGFSTVNLSTQAGSQSALSVIDGAIDKVSQIRANLGAVENRLNHSVSSLMNVSENAVAARSVITDADFAVESANLAKAQVLMQAGTAMLAQANAAPQMVLQLLQ